MGCDTFFGEEAYGDKGTDTGQCAECNIADTGEVEFERDYYERKWGDCIMGMFTREQSLSEIEDESELLEAKNKKAGLELSYAQKRYATAELKKRGLEPKHFGFNWGRIWKWLKEH